MLQPVGGGSGWGSDAIPHTGTASSLQGPRGRRQQPCIQAAAHQHSDLQPQQHGATGRASFLRHIALLSAAAAAAPLPAAAAAAVLPPLGTAAATLTSGPRSALQLADPQLLPMPPGPIAFPRRQLDLTFAVSWVVGTRCRNESRE